jgi:Hemerythrin HHE cation binding domain
MEQPRYNLFNLIHKALRNMLYDTALKIQRNDFTSVEETLPIMAQLEQVLFYFDEHARHEDTFILPVVQKHDAKLITDFEYEHDEDHRLAGDMRAFITQWRMEKHKGPQVIWGERIFYSFNKFVAFNLYHTNKEERLLNPVLWKHYSDLELQGITQRIIQSIKPDILMAQSRWMMKSINRNELITWMVGVKQAAPLHVFNMYLKIAQEELPQSLWLEVKTILLEDAVMA